MSILWWFVKPKEITKEDVANAEKDYENVFKRWCVSSGPEISDELRQLILDKYLEMKSVKKVYKALNIKDKVVKQVINEAGYGKCNQKYVIQYDVNHKEIRRFGCLQDCCKWLIDNNIVQTKLYKTCRNTLNRNLSTLWHNYYFELMDA